MDTFTIVAAVCLTAWLARLTFIVGRIDEYLRETEECVNCRKAATVSAAESADDDF